MSERMIFFFGLKDIYMYLNEDRLLFFFMVTFFFFPSGYSTLHRAEGIPIMCRTFSFSFPQVTLRYTAPRRFLSCAGYISRPSSFFFFFFSFFSFFFSLFSFFFSSPPPHQSSILTIIQRFPTILLTHHTNTLMHRPIMPLTPG